jgi:preprotein translocase subunit SecG
MLIGILLTLNIIVCLGLIGVVLLQRSEGGALGMGGGPTGFMSARGAGDLLTRMTWILFACFLALSLALTLLSGRGAASSSITDKLKIDSVDPNSLTIPVAPTPGAAPAAPATAPANAQPAPVQAPTPGLNPLLAPAPTQDGPRQ